MAKLTRLAALALFVVLAGTMLAQAEPMKCGSEDKTCQQACAKGATATKPACLTACGVRKSACMRTGCWDNGTRRFCGLLKQ